MARLQTSSLDAMGMAIPSTCLRKTGVRHVAKCRSPSAQHSSKVWTGTGRVAELQVASEGPRMWAWRRLKTWVSSMVWHRARSAWLSASRSGVRGSEAFLPSARWPRVSTAAGGGGEEGGRGRGEGLGEEQGVGEDEPDRAKTKGTAQKAVHVGLAASGG